MSTDYSALCFVCKKAMHVGQTMAGKPSFAHGYRHNPDYATESTEVAKFLFEHVDHGPVLIVFADDTPSTFERVDL
jgi:hypothetical protein